MKYPLALRQNAAEVPWADGIRARYQEELGHDARGQLSLSLLTTALEEVTARGYGQKLKLWFDFCAEEKADALHPDERLALRYVAALGERGTIGAENLQPYFSAVNTFHRDLGVEPVLLGRAVARARQGLLGLQAASARRDEQAFLPAEWVLRMERAALDLLATTHTSDAARFAALLPLVATVAPFVFFHRAGTSARLLPQDLWVDRTAGTICLRERHVKGKARNKTARIITIPVAGVPTLATLVERFKALHAIHGHPRALWLRAGDPPPRDASALMTAHLETALAHIEIQRGAAASHSARHGAATAAASLNIPDRKICYYGGWVADSAALKRYIHMGVLPNDAARHYFGWMLWTGAAPPRPHSLR